jgi:hypothetical protein
MREEALQGLREATWEVIQRPKRLGLTLVPWREGKVTRVAPEDAEADYLAARARAQRDESQKGQGS